MAAPPGGKLRLSWPLAHHFLRQGGGERGQLHNQSRTERSFQRGLTTVAHRAGFGRSHSQAENLRRPGPHGAVRNALRVGGGGQEFSRTWPGAAEQIAAVCAGHDYSKPGKPKIDWDDPQAKDALVSALVNDANALVETLKDRGLDERAASALALLALVAGQDVEPAEGSDGRDGRWRIARKVAPDRVVSTVDPDARHASMSGRSSSSQHTS